MSNQHIIGIEREARLSADEGRLKIEFISVGQVHYVAFSDIAVVLAAHPQINISLPAQRELAKNGAVLLIIDEKFMPCALSLPLGINLEGAKRPHLQAKFYNEQEKGLWWAQIIKAKIAGQAKVASVFNKTLSEKLLLFAENVAPADKDCMEARAAQAYWPEYLGALDSPILFREKQNAGDPINISLNYGYAIIRAIIARSLASAGLCLNLGVGHHRRDNPFNLADDFIEPFRYLVDMAVFSIFKYHKYGEFSSEIKKRILSSLINTCVEIAGKEYRLFQAVDFSVNSFCLSLDDPRRRLNLPNQGSSRGKKSNIISPSFHFEYET